MNLAIIPARGGSKSIIQKNLAKVGNESLVARSIICAQNAGVEHIFVSTDDFDIVDEVLKYGAIPIRRPEEISGDFASSESAILHSLIEIKKILQIENANILFLQATSPFTDSKDLTNVLKEIGNGISFFSAYNFHSFLWEANEGTWNPLAHDKDVRLMKEELGSVVVETGNFYCFELLDFLREKTRFCGTPKPFLIDPIRSLQIDSVEELISANKLANFFDVN